MTARPILNYHAVGATASRAFRPWTIAPDLLDLHLDVLERRGRRGVSVAELLDNDDPSLVGLTFDDAYADFSTLAATQLVARGFTATLFVPTAHVGATARWLAPDAEAERPIASWEQLRSVQRLGIEIGSHSHSHPQLDLLDPEDVAVQVRRSAEILEAELDHPVRGFCYPHGFHTTAVRRAVIDAGYDYACAVKHEMSHDDDDRHALARIVITGDCGVDALEALLDGRGLRRARPGVERARTKAFRSYRRLRKRLAA